MISIQWGAAILAANTCCGRNGRASEELRK
jgi:hypothetical protein